MATSQTDSGATDASSLFGVKGMVAVVTGGGTGIGLMITKALVQNGASKVYILGRRLAKLEEAAAAFVGGSSTTTTTTEAVVVPVVCDVTSTSSLQAAASRIQSETGFVNLLVCNSGIGGPFGIRAGPQTTLDQFVEANLAVPVDDFTNTFAVNTSAVWYTTMAFLRLLDAGNKNRSGRGGGDGGDEVVKSQVVAISSIAGFNKQNTGGFAYGQSKAACTHLVKQLSLALPQWDIRANAICAGLYPSEMSAPIINRGGIGKDMIPLGRAGDEKDMTGAILYLASRAGAYCNGTIIVTDGGRLTTFPSTF
ncbi:NAD(P)-binding protein [Xylariomycetidae sp. FL2044]|nr:NAD(P)-binding protein [Xylariomycetidae sp. FL2044]